MDAVATMRPPRLSVPDWSRASVVVRTLARFTSRTVAQRSAGILARVRSRVMPALWTRASRAGTASVIRSAASGDVMSTGSAVASRRAARSSRSACADGTSRRIRRAPSRARTSATASPIPRAAPVTRAVRPARGRAQSAGAVVSPDATSITWPLTYADLGDRRKRRVDSAAATGPSTRTRVTVRPRPISLPRERTNPSSACWEAAWWWSSRESGAPSTTMRPLGATERTTGCRAACTSASAAMPVTAVASRTIAAGRSAAATTSGPVRASSPASSAVCPDSPAVRWSNGPSSAGRSGVQRCSGAGWGRPRRRVRKRPGAVPVKFR